jgi:hypothetical protein
MTYVPGDRHNALVYVVRGLMWAIEHYDASDEQKSQMAIQAQLCLRDIGVGKEEMELAIFSKEGDRQ